MVKVIIRTRRRTSLTIEYELDFDVLKQFIYKAIERCDSMRLRFVYDNKEKQWYQYVVKKEEREIAYFDFSENTMEEAETVMTSWTRVPFELQDSPMIRIAKNIKLFEPNMILMVPLMIETIAKKLESAALLPAPVVKAKVFGKQFHAICSGGAYMNPAYIDTFQKYGITILQGYGMTECAPVISTNLLWNSKKGSVGKLLPNCEVKTVDEELWVKGSSVMRGYYHMPEETAETLLDGWLKTGDLGYVDEDGFVFLTGRKKNLIITPNGENVSPEEIENKLSENRIIQEVLVRNSDGVIEAEIYPDYEYAAKKKVKDMQNTLQEIIDAYNRNAPLYKRIVKLKIRETEFEKNTTKKIKRF